MSLTEEKYCYRCKETKSVDDFGVNKNKKDGRCDECKNCKSTYMKDYYLNNKKTIGPKNRRRDKDLRARNWQIVFDHYGSECACCGEKEKVFLTIDHINGGGSKHRKEIGSHIERWLVKMNLPEGFQVLCHNCNWAKHLLGSCPHQVGDLSWR